MKKIKLLTSAGIIALVLSTGGLFTATATAAPPEDSTIGKSHSNPDGGGVDKPYDAAGQGAASQGGEPFDGNNGCGQEKKAGESPDPELGLDDNNGNCGNKHNQDDPDGDGDLD